MPDPGRNSHLVVAGQITVPGKGRVREALCDSGNLERIDDRRRCDRPGADQPVDHLERRQLPATLLAVCQMGLDDGTAERIQLPVMVQS